MIGIYILKWPTIEYKGYSLDIDARLQHLQNSLRSNTAPTDFQNAYEEHGMPRIKKVICKKDELHLLCIKHKIEYTEDTEYEDLDLLKDLSIPDCVYAHIAKKYYMSNNVVPMIARGTWKTELKDLYPSQYEKMIENNKKR